MRRGDRSEVETARAGRPHLRRRATVLPWIVLAVFLSASVTAFAVRRETVGHASRNNFNAAAQNVTNGITTSLRRYQHLLTDVQRLKPPNSPLTHEQFQQYAATHSLPINQGLAALALIERVEPAQLQEFDRQAKAEGGAGVRPTTRPDQVNFLVGQTAPTTALLGADIHEYAPADKAVNEARDTGKIALTRAPPLSKFLGVPKSSGERGMIVLAAPIYSTPRVPPTVEARRAHLSAVIGIVLSPVTLLAQATGAGRTNVDVGVALYEGDHTDEAHLLATTQPTPSPPVRPDVLRSTTTYDAFGQRLTIRYVSLVSFASLSKNEPWLYLGAVALRVGLGAHTRQCARARNGRHRDRDAARERRAIPRAPRRFKRHLGRHRRTRDAQVREPGRDASLGLRDRTDVG